MRSQINVSFAKIDKKQQLYTTVVYTYTEKTILFLKYLHCDNEIIFILMYLMNLFMTGGGSLVEAKQIHSTHAQKRLQTVECVVRHMDEVRQVDDARASCSITHILLRMATRDR